MEFKKRMINFDYKIKGLLPKAPEVFKEILEDKMEMGTSGITCLDLDTSRCTKKGLEIFKEIQKIFKNIEANPMIKFVLDWPVEHKYFARGYRTEYGTVVWALVKDNPTYYEFIIDTKGVRFYEELKRANKREGSVIIEDEAIRQRVAV